MHALFNLLHGLGLPGIFLLLFFENMGIPLPTEAGYIVAQTLITHNTYSYWTVFAVLQASHCAGALSAYAVGHYFRDRRHNLPINNESAGQAQDKLDVWFSKYGNITVFLSRLIGYVRPWSSYLAGIARTSFWPFFFYTFLGTFVFNVISLSVTGTLTALWRHHPAFRAIMVLFFILSFAAIFIYNHAQKRAKKKTSTPLVEPEQ